MQIGKAVTPLGGIPAESTPSTLKAYVVERLRDDILAGKYKPGDRLNESQIAREFDISRIPVREALSQLQVQGLVMSHERRGMFVTLLSSDDVQRINSVRIVLETEALHLARKRMTPSVAAALSEIVYKMEAWDGALIDAAALDLEFHRTIWKASGNPYLERSLDALATSLFAHKALEHVSFEMRRWRLNHHRALLEVVAGPSAEDPQSAILTHLRLAYTEPERFSSLGPPVSPLAEPIRLRP